MGRHSTQLRSDHDMCHLSAASVVIPVQGNADLRKAKLRQLEREREEEAAWFLEQERVRLALEQAEAEERSQVFTTDLNTTLFETGASSHTGSFNVRSLCQGHDYGTSKVQ